MGTVGIGDLETWRLGDKFLSLTRFPFFSIPMSPSPHVPRSPSLPTLPTLPCSLAWSRSPI
ncbi:MAG: hypothetical protein F6J93_32225 [Oscillatoria sp. SIO1A7]|nr:hypothetical protein [Oscillatoria sp. SIO1A7]